MGSELCSGVRLRLLEFLIQSTHELQVRPIVKYSALSLFADRFCLSLSRHGNDMENWLLHPMRESNLQLFALVSIWISSKMHDSYPLSVKCLKSLGDKMIKEQHFTTRDFLEAEVVLMQVLDFEIGTSNIAFKFLEELFIQFKGIATVGKLVNFEACMDIMDLLYEKDQTSALYNSPKYLAASILVASYVITVPKQRWEFPVLPWGTLKLNTDGCSKGNPGQAGYGGLLRDDTGIWVWGYYGYLGHCTSLEAEIWAIYRGLTILFQKGMTNVIIETDSEQALLEIQQGPHPNSPLKALIEDAKFLLQRCHCSITPTLREGNKVADRLANLGVTQTEHVKILEDPPMEVISLLIEDKTGVVGLRE